MYSHHFRTIISILFWNMLLLVSCANKIDSISDQEPDYQCIDPILLVYNDLSDSHLVGNVSQYVEGRVWLRIVSKSDSVNLAVNGIKHKLLKDYLDTNGYIDISDESEIILIQVEDLSNNKCTEFILDIRYSYITIYTDQDDDYYFVVSMSNINNAY